MKNTIADNLKHNLRVVKENAIIGGNLNNVNYVI